MKHKSCVNKQRHYKGKPPVGCVHPVQRPLHIGFLINQHTGYSTTSSIRNVSRNVIPFEWNKFAGLEEV